MKERLGNFVKIQTGKKDANAANAEGKYPFFTCAVEPLKINTYSYNCECVLVAGNGDLNVKYYFGKFEAYQRTYIIESSCPEKLLVPYLYRYLCNYIVFLRRQSIGGVIKYIKLNNLTEAQISLPDIEIQKKIIDEFDCLDKILDKRKKQLEDLDLLVNSRFIEMFGTYPRNQKGWKTCTIRDVVTDVRYGSTRPAVDGGKYPYLRMNNITYSGELNLSDIKYIDIPDKELDKCIVRYGDVLFNRTNSKELVGKTCVYDRKDFMVLAGFVIRVRVTDHIHPEFLSAFLNTDFSKQMLFGMCKTAIGQANINAQELQNIGIYLPPLVLQQQFVLLKKQVNKSKLAVQKSIDQLEILKKSLMQKYFG